MEKFVILSQPKKLEKIDYDYIKELEYKLMTNDILLKEEIEDFLDYLVYIVRKKLDPNFEAATYKNLCNRAQCMIHYYLEKLGIKNFLNRSFYSITKDAPDHSFIVAIFNINGNATPYIIDPTYRQFFETERCQKRILTPGNFILDKKIIMDFLKNGYMEMNEKNTYVYGNSFYFSSPSIPKPIIPINGAIYAKAFLKGNAKISKSEEDLKDENLYIEPLILKEITLPKEK